MRFSPTNECSFCHQPINIRLNVPNSGKNGYVVMGGTSVPVYQKLIDKTKDLHLKANSCCQKIDKKLTLGI